ncbi:hypothetical protein BOVA604_3343 [Bacteroides ovatus]|nr:hypothetical protein BSGG_2806 [Bacteroides sp. D2]RGN65796.1 fimbrillin family protein [Bacteroides sp. OM05-10AA]RGQ68154.1 fimbrillin family protein [Bacteroides sp. AF27-33]CAG9898106.1 hypothetical protein BOVA604_3343 [Bacteroides ovatus]
MSLIIMKPDSRKLRMFAWLFVMAAGGVLTSCTSDEKEISGSPDNKYPMEFVGQVFNQSITRTTSEGTWTGTEEVGVQVGDGIKLYKADTYGALTTEDTPFYWESKTATVDVLAWFPCNGTEALPASFPVQQDQNQNDGFQNSDFLRAKGIFTFSGQQPALDFYHLPAKVKLNLKAGEGVEDPETVKNAEVTFVNMALASGEINMATGEVAQTTGEATIIPQKLDEESVTEGCLQTLQALLVPQQMRGKQFIKVVVDGVEAYYIPAEDDANLQAGYLYVYNIEITHRNEIEVTLAVSGPAWAEGKEQTVVSSTYYTADDMKPGDFFYRTADGTGWAVSDGGLRKVNHATGEKEWETPAQSPVDFTDGRVCIGIVFQTESKRISALEKAKGWTHGYVMALTDAAEKCTWGDKTIDEDTGEMTEGINYFPNLATNFDMYGDIDGYGKKVYIAGQKLAGVTTADGTLYDVFYHSENYGTDDSGQYAAPADGTTSGWYLPTIGQWWDILENLGDANGLIALRNSSGTTVELKNGVSQVAIDRMNELMSASGQTVTLFKADVHYWSSSEKSSGVARRVLFDGSGKKYSLRIGDNNKDNPSTNVRCILAF